MSILELELHLELLLFGGASWSVRMFECLNVRMFECLDWKQPEQLAKTTVCSYSYSPSEG